MRTARCGLALSGPSIEASKEVNMPKQRSLAAVIAAALLAFPLYTVAQDRGPSERLVEKYDRFAGSEQNARELVTGLRNDTEIELTRRGKTTEFTPATSKMGWGNVDHALALAKASLADQGIHNPTPEQIKATLNGGTITTKSGEQVKLDGVLKMRASGMGWGEIAHKLGFKLGELKRHVANDHKPDRSHDWKHARDKHERGDWKRDHRPEFHLAKFERPEKPGRPERPERPERHGRGR
jgi:hypothetical protein